MPSKGYLFDPKKRFSSRVEDYIKHRPRYPPELIEFMRSSRLLSKEHILADVGSGTGILSENFLKNGNKVYCVEPNTEMRNAAERLLKDYPNFISIDGSAEDTNLHKNCVDIITAGQAFHWFDIKMTKIEFKKILKPYGYVALIWNNRRKTEKGFSCQYEQLIRKYGTDYHVVRSSELNIDEFFKYKRKIFYNYQDLDFNGLKGRLLSTSYIPLENNQKFENMLEELRTIFDEYEKLGKIRIEYDTEINYGQLD
ncbi:MAG: class I SAM-dependent methyltransferase [Promethearchaeota archaeon]|jgi:ubiquinone/menaquinone biosynthesis C-methylase UbiE